MNRTLIGRPAATLIILVLCAIVAQLIRRDHQTRALLVRTICDLIAEARHD